MKYCLSEIGNMRAVVNVILTFFVTNTQSGCQNISQYSSSWIIDEVWDLWIQLLLEWLVLWNKHSCLLVDVGTAKILHRKTDCLAWLQFWNDLKRRWLQMLLNISSLQWYLANTKSQTSPLATQSAGRSFLKTPRVQRLLFQRSTQKPYALTHRRTCTPSRHPFELPQDKSSGVWCG